MVYQTPTNAELVLLTVGEPSRTRQGNLFIECDTDQGVVAVWGGRNNANLDRLRAATPPARLRCGVIDSNWPQHRFWVPESTKLEVLEAVAQPSPVAITLPSPVLADELNKCRRRILRLLEVLFGKPEPEDGLVSRVTALKRDGRIPRKIAALILAVTELRNAAEHQNELPTPTETDAARYAWKAVAEWALAQGVDVNSL